MTGEEIIVTFKEPWYNDYTRRLYTQLSEQMIREEIERVHKEPIITNAAFDIAVIQGFHSSPRSVVYSTTSNYTYVSTNPTGTQWTAATTRPQLTGLTKGLYVNEAGTNTFMLIGNNMKSVSTDRGNNWTTSTLGEYTLTDLIYVDSNWYAIGSNGIKRLLLQNTVSTFDQSNKILDLPDYSRQVIKINT